MSLTRDLEKPILALPLHWIGPLLLKTYVNVQQTPNPAAQFPSAVPDFELHSEDVRQLPYIDVSDLAVH